MNFIDRADAGKRLALLLRDYEAEHPIVLGLPRGGVPVAFEVAAALKAPLDVWMVRKVGAPDFPELAIGAVAEGGIVYLNQETIEAVGVSAEEVRELVRKKSEEVVERVRRFRGDAPAPQLAGKSVILVDDGIATGSTVRAALQALRQTHPLKIVLAVPVAAAQSLEKLRPLADDIVCVTATPELYAIGAWYYDFSQVSDDEVASLLTLAKGEKVLKPQPRPAATVAVADPREITISIGGGELKGILSVPPDPIGLVLFAHGSGSGRLSPRNQYVASTLQRRGLATLLFDLLTNEEESIDEKTGELRFDIELLAGRLVHVTDWAGASADTGNLRLGYFGASTGAAAALMAAAERPSVVRAVVSRGGRPDLAYESLPRVMAPTLLIVGGEDHAVIKLNQRAYSQLNARRKFVIIPGASHLFEEPGALDAVARLAGEWFIEHFEEVRPGTPSQLKSAEAPLEAH